MPGPPPCRYCNLIFHIVGRGLAPPPHIVFIAPYSRQVAHVGAAYMPPAPPSYRNPLCLSPPTTPIYTLSKNHSQNLSKKSKTALDKSHTHCYNNQAVSRRTRREKRFITACICFLKKKFFKKLSENPLTIKRF